MKANYCEPQDDQLARRLAHDIASPLTVMQLNMRFVKNILPIENFNMMESAINQIREIMQSVSHKKEDRLALNLNSIVKNIIAEKKYEWKANPCELKFMSGENLDCLIYANKSGIYRLLSNVLNNAYESLLEKRKIDMHLQQTENHILLSIVDSGCGIPQNKLNLVMCGESLKTFGHGIGLSSSVNYMKSVGGELKLQSKEKEGTEVQLIFPRKL